MASSSVLTDKLRSRPTRKADKKLGTIGVHAGTPKKIVRKSVSPEHHDARQTSRMEAIGQLAGGIAHDFNNLLTVILGHSEFLLDRQESAKSRRVRIEEIRKAAEHGARLTKQLLAYSRNQILEPTVLQLNEVLDDMDKILRRVLGEDVALDLLLTTELGWAKVDRGQLQQIILNLAGNARDAMPQGGRFRIETTNLSITRNSVRSQPYLKAGEYVAIIARDSGQGMDAATRSRIFEPFFTTKEKGKGTGLGLATVYGIVKQSGGYVWVESEPGHGSSFYTILPRVPAPANQKVLQETFDFHSGGETILLVEDDPALRKMAAEVLRDTGYKVLTAPSGPDALQIAAEHRGHLDVLLTDIVMPGMTGRELATLVTVRHPQTQVLYMTGYTDDAVVNHGLRGQSMRVLHKPFTHQELVSHVRGVLERLTRT